MTDVGYRRRLPRVIEGQGARAPASTETNVQENSKMSTKSLIIAAAVGLAALAGGVSAADAKNMGMGKSMGMNKGIGMSMDHHNFYRHDHGLRFIVSSYPDCSYLYDKWQWTGDYIWKAKYLACRYGTGW
jgi:hypothetical protein